MKNRNPVETMANARHEFGEHGGVNMSVEASTTFTVMHSNTMPEIFGGKKGLTREAVIFTAVISIQLSITSANNWLRWKAPRPPTAVPAVCQLFPRP